jgi:hypothetical protein
MAQKALFTAALFVLGLGTAALGAQDKAKIMTMVGVVEKTGGEQLVVSSDGKKMTYIITDKTVAKGPAFGGKKGLKLTELVYVGDQVQVRYMDTGGKMVATEVEVLQGRTPSARPVK